MNNQEILIFSFEHNLSKIKSCIDKIEKISNISAKTKIELKQFDKKLTDITISMLYFTDKLKRRQKQ